MVGSTNSPSNVFARSVLPMTIFDHVRHGLSSRPCLFQHKIVPYQSSWAVSFISTRPGLTPPLSCNLELIVSYLTIPRVRYQYATSITVGKYFSTLQILPLSSSALSPIPVHSFSSKRPCLCPFLCSFSAIDSCSLHSLFVFSVPSSRQNVNLRLNRLSEPSGCSGCGLLETAL